MQTFVAMLRVGMTSHVDSPLYPIYKSLLKTIRLNGKLSPQTKVPKP